MVRSPLGPPLVWTLPSGVIAYGGLFGDITIVEPGEVEHRAGPIAAGGRILDGNIDSSVAMWVTAPVFVAVGEHVRYAGQLGEKSLRPLPDCWAGV